MKLRAALRWGRLGSCDESETHTATQLTSPSPPLHAQIIPQKCRLQQIHIRLAPLRTHLGQLRLSAAANSSSVSPKNEATVD
ncbi:hypothetical protein GN956_G5959 [Arapaima gigas]